MKQWEIDSKKRLKKLPYDHILPSIPSGTNLLSSLTPLIRYFQGGVKELSKLVPEGIEGFIQQSFD